MKKVAITGPSRSGTTLTLMYFYNAGYNIGYSDSNIENYYRYKHNGFEFFTDKFGRRPKTIPDCFKETFRKGDKGFITALDWVNKFNIDISHLIVCQRPNAKEMKESLSRLYDHKIKHTYWFKFMRKNKLAWINQRYPWAEKGKEKLSRQLKLLPNSVSVTYLDYPKQKEDFEYWFETFGPIFEKDRNECYSIWDKSIDRNR